jgi:hypothetical protein
LKFDKLFGHTYIGAHRTRERGNHHILSFSFNDVSPTGDLRRNFCDYINTVVADFIKKYPEVGKEVAVNPDNHLATLVSLFGAIRRARQSIYVIVDEYDSFANRLLLDIDTTGRDLGRNQYEASVSSEESILRDFGNTLKSGTAGAIARMFFTGVTPIAFADGLSSLNIVLDLSAYPFFETTFGFTADEVKDALALIYPRNSTEFENCFVEMQRNFDGYRFHKDQQVAVFNPQMCLYYLNVLNLVGKAPESLLDDNFAAGNVVEFLKNNYRSKTTYKNPIDFVLGSFDKELFQSFRSKDLFDESTVDGALVSFAFYCGFLTFADPAMETQKGRLVPPNMAMKELFMKSLVKGLPKDYLRQLWSAVTIVDNADRLVAFAKLGKVEEKIEEAGIKEAMSYVAKLLVSFFSQV